jgi:hypothetical protein
MSENEMIIAIVGLAMVCVLVQPGDRMARLVDRRFYYSRWSRPFRYSKKYGDLRIHGVDKAEWRLRRSLQRERRRTGESIHQ